MSYATSSPLGAVYHVNAPIIGEADVTVPTEKFASDFIDAATAAFDRNSDRLVGRLYRSMADEFPAFVDRTYPVLAEKVAADLAVRFAEKKKQLLRGAVVAGAAATLVVVAAALVGKKRKAAI